MTPSSYIALRLEPDGRPMAAEYALPSMPATKYKRIVRQTVAKAESFVHAARIAAELLDTVEDADWRSRLGYVHHLLIEDALGNRLRVRVVCTKIEAHYEAQEVRRG